MSASRTDRTRATYVVLIDSRALERECFMRGIESGERKMKVVGFKAVADWIQAMDVAEMPDSILYNSGGRRMADKQVVADILDLKALCAAPIIVLSSSEELSEIIASIDLGAEGYIPASLGIEATLIAIRLAALGAACIPSASILAVRSVLTKHEESKVPVEFTARQSTVADGLRRGKPNKIIAYDLNMCESTVKVHIRNIMKKLNARNRTEAGYKLNLLIPELRGSPKQGSPQISTHANPVNAGAGAGAEWPN